MTHRRLYVTRAGGCRFTMAVDSKSAHAITGAPMRLPRPNELRRLLEHTPVAEVCRRFDVSRQTLSNWRRRAGITAPGSVVERVADDVERLVRQGLPLSRVAERLSCHESTCRKVVRARGLTVQKFKRQPTIADAQLEKLVDECTPGLGPVATIAEIAFRADVSPSTIYRRLSKRRDLARVVRAIAMRGSASKESHAQ